jgi:hypothetical protein
MPSSFDADIARLADALARAAAAWYRARQDAQITGTVPSGQGGAVPKSARNARDPSPEASTPH